LLQGKRWKAGDTQQVSPGDLAWLAVALLLICTTFAVEEGLCLRLRDADAVARMGRDNVVNTRVFRDGRIEINGRPVTIDMVKPAVDAALAADDRSIIVLDTDADAGYGLSVELLRQVRLAGAPRVVLRRRGR